MRRISLVTCMFVLGLAITVPGLRAQSKEVDLDATMKKVQPAFMALRKGIEAMDANIAKEQTAILRTSFADVEKFFEAQGKHDGHGWASDARKAVDAIAAAAAGSKWDEVKASA